MNRPAAQLKLSSLTLDLFIGCWEHERTSPQRVVIDTWIFFTEPPLGCLSDQLFETFNYDEIHQALCETAQKKHYQLIEHLAYEIYQRVKELTQKKIVIKVTKFPDLKNLGGGVSFTLGESIKSRAKI